MTNQEEQKCVPRNWFLSGFAVAFVVVIVLAFLGTKVTINVAVGSDLKKAKVIEVELLKGESVFDAYVESGALNLKLWKDQGMSRLVHRKLYQPSTDVILKWPDGKKEVKRVNKD